MRLASAAALILGACKYTAPTAPPGDGGFEPDVPDATVIMIDAPVTDGFPGGAFCVGTFAQVCSPTDPTNDLTLSNAAFDTTINGNCNQILQGPAGPEVCVIVGHNITIDGTFNAIGVRPLFIVAFNDFTLKANVELSASSSTVTSTRGAGANNAITVGSGCEVTAINGGNNAAGGGGAAGGSHRGAGGSGSTAHGGAGGPAGQSGPTVPAWTFVRGGCPGGRGGNGVGTGGPGGLPGGAILIIAGNKLKLEDNAAVVASGGAGRAALAASGGGGGGGSGGFIGLDSPMLEVGANTRVIANGGAGASGAAVAQNGQRGDDGTDTATVANGGTAGGGDGGAGAFTTTLDGAPGIGGVATEGGGGGGGGVGVIFEFDDTTTNGIFSPAAFAQ